ncbi:hypothetical protein SDRG_05778 [Saprolegnia diclina VS20]|uniref:Uncharacterized protein n=1 Tax=Saprolegnia diclina (strain VS20) TaxID=1156394 RepID=T0QG95_SAPDV|nr:hypothetical protein SDRG_05778 [Saprolegnia diclina VS20]EQC36954.1 hypothetical protein SDRG_05778 [Saprolegnia diclina VS20]|eukprot:XP_008609735.1 hypothetical protein SDRG_05778 [Saprolegnia diclina VS20]
MAPQRRRAGKSTKDAHANLSAEERVAAGTDAKNRGNAAYAAGDHATAIKEFTAAIAFEPENHIYYSNRSAAYLSAGNAAQAMADANKCIEIDAKWGKGYARLGAAYYFIKSYQKAVQAYTKGLTVDKGNKQLQAGLTQAQAAYQVLEEEASGVEMDDATRKMKRMEIEDKINKARAEREERAKRAERGFSEVIGIDLGTTYSCVGVWKDGQVEIIANSEGNRTTPSWVAFNEAERLIGDAAKLQAASNATNTVFDAKRIIGRAFSDPIVKKDAAHFPFKIVEGDEDKPLIQVSFKGEDKRFTPEEISSMVLTRMKETAENYLGQEIKQAVVTVPAYFNDQQRQSTKDAGAIAGLDVKRIINEPTAAALAYGLDTNAGSDGNKANILIFDLGGGTFDVSILSIENGIFEVKSTGGDTHLGGEDFDSNMTVGRVMSVLIKRNTAIPIKKTRVYTTEEDYQTQVDVCIYEGERACVDHNNKLGEFTISGIERAKRGEPQVQVTFEIDANGILNVSALDKKTNAKAETTINNNNGRLTQEDIDRMVADAEKFKKDDAEVLKKIEARNSLESFIYRALELTREKGDAAAENTIREAREWLEDHEDATLRELEEKKRVLERLVR